VTVPVRTASRLRADLPALASGRALVIDYFASARCGTVVGDITADLGNVPPPGTHAQLDDVAGVPVYAERRLLPLLEEAGLQLEPRRLPFGRAVRVRLDRPELWLDFLECPGVAIGKGPWRRRRRTAG
jgi:hypothetical protein